MDASVGFVTRIGMDVERTLARADALGFDFAELSVDGANERRGLAAGEAAADLGVSPDRNGRLSPEVFTPNCDYSKTSEDQPEAVL